MLENKYDIPSSTWTVLQSLHLMNPCHSIALERQDSTFLQVHSVSWHFKRYKTTSHWWHLYNKVYRSPHLVIFWRLFVRVTNIAHERRKMKFPTVLFNILKTLIDRKKLSLDKMIFTIRSTKVSIRSNGDTPLERRKMI